jgi:hypothetical protein
MNAPLFHNRIRVRLMMCGTRFKIGKRELKWSHLGTFYGPDSYAPYVDNVNIFEAAWIIDKKHSDVRSLDEGISGILEEIWVHKTKLLFFANERRLRFIVDCYVEYRETAPLLELGQESIKKLATLGCSVGLEVVKLPQSQ